MGNRDGGARPRRGYAQSSEDDDTSDDDSSLDTDEEAHLQSALARVKRAQAKGRTDVKLSKEELTALERHRARESSKASKRKVQRVAIPISQLDPGPQKRPSIQESSSRRHSPELGEERQQPGYPAMGFFPPPSSSRAPRSRPDSIAGPSGRSGIEREQSSSPFSYSYVRPADPTVSARQSSDPLLSSPAVPELARQSSAASDPFQYMTTSSRTPYRAGTGSPGDATYAYGSSVVDPARRADRRRSDDYSSGEEQSDDDISRPARITSSGKGSSSLARPTEKSPAVERSADRRVSESSKKSSSSSKRKVVATTSSSSKGRRKAK